MKLITHTTIFLVLFLSISVNCYEGFISDLSIGTWRVITALAEDLLEKTPPLTDDAYKSEAEFYQSYGYRFEKHKIVTEDGYILTAFRIPGKLTDSKSQMENKPPVMLQHGLFDNSGSFSIGSFQRGLPFLLSEQGYDVWITNSRGNVHSYEHLNPKEYSIFDSQSKYWNFSVDGMGIYDVPANIDYILDYTSSKSLTYIGHSQGTAQFFIANSMLNIATKINAFVGLGPVIYCSNQKSPIAVIMNYFGVINILKYFKINNIMIWPEIVNVELKNLIGHIRKSLWRFIQMICGIEEEITVDLSRMPVLMRNEPGGSSLTNLIHWLQMFDSGAFQRMDYGEEENMKIYGQPTAPLYDIEALKENLKDMPMMLVRGEVDSLVTEKDFNKLLEVFEDKPGK